MDAVKYLFEFIMRARPPQLALSEPSQPAGEQQIENEPSPIRDPAALVGSQSAHEKATQDKLLHEEHTEDASEWNQSHQFVIVSSSLLALVIVIFWCAVVRRVRSQTRYIKELEMKLYIIELALREERQRNQAKEYEMQRRQVEYARERKKWEETANIAAQEIGRERKLSRNLSDAFDRISKSHSSQMKSAESKVDRIKVVALEGIRALSFSYKQRMQHLISMSSSHALHHEEEMNDLQNHLKTSIQEIKRQRDKGRQLESQLLRREMEADDHIRELEDLAMKNNRATALLSAKDDQIKHDRQLRDKLQVSLQEAEERVQEQESELKAARTNLMIEVEASLRARDYIASLTNEKEALEAEAAKIPAFEEKIAQASERMRSLMGRLVAGEQQVQLLQQEIRERDKEVKSLEETLVRVKDEGSDRERRLEVGWQRKAKESQALLDAKEGEVKARVGDIEVLKDELLRCREEILALVNKSSGLKKQPMVLSNLNK